MDDETEDVTQNNRPGKSGVDSAAAGTKDRSGILQIALGLIWLLDGALQFQPFMFTRGFVTQIILPSSQGNPGWVADPTISLAHYIEPHIAAWNAFFATLQVLIGLGIAGGVLAKRPAIVKTALLGSIAWALLVWWLSEGLGGILQGGSPLSGAPGAVILYGIIAVLVWPSNREIRGSHMPAPSRSETEHRLPGRISTAGYILQDLQDRVTSDTSAKIIWAVLWIFNGFLLLEPANQMPQAVSMNIKSAMPGQPGWLHSLLASSASALSGTGAWLDSLLAVAMIIIGAGVAFNLYPRVLLSAGIVISLAIWILGEGLGGILTGQGTDPNTGPLWIILAACLWARTTKRDKQLTHHYSSHTSNLTQDHARTLERGAAY